MRTHLRVLLVGFALLPTLFAAEKMLEWQNGKVLDTGWGRVYSGTIGSANTNGTFQSYGNYGRYQGYSSGSQLAVYRVYKTFVIESPTHVYVAVESVRWRWSKPANLTVNGTVRFALDKRKIYVEDEDGKVHEMGINKKILRVPQPVTP